MSEKIAISRETLTVLADEHCPYGLLMAAKAIARDLLAKHPLISALHENGDLIALQATVAKQAKMIEHLRGGRIGVAVMVPDRQELCGVFADCGDAEAEGWNACIDKVIELNQTVVSGFTAVDMDNAARDGFRDGKASRDEAVKLARRTLWIAFNWNDHNFGPAHLQARKEAEELGITTFEQANAWLEAQG